MFARPHRRNGHRNPGMFSSDDEEADDDKTDDELQKIIEQLTKYPSYFELEKSVHKLKKTKWDSILKRLETEMENGYDTNLETVRSHNFRTFICMKYGETDKAREANEEAMHLQDDNICALVAKAMLLCSEQNSLEAEDVQDRLSELQENGQTFAVLGAEAEGELGYAYSRMSPKFYEDSIQKFETALEVCPNRFIWKFGFALMVRRCLHMSSVYLYPLKVQSKMRVRLAVEYLVDIAQDATDSEGSLRGKAYIEIAEFLNYVDSFLFLEPLKHVVHSTLTTRTGREWGMEELLKMAVRQAPRAEFVHERCGKYLRYLKRYDQAREHLETAINIRPTSFSHHHLGLVFRTLAFRNASRQQRAERGRGYGRGRGQSRGRGRGQYRGGGRGQGSGQGRGEGRGQGRGQGKRESQRWENNEGRSERGGPGGQGGDWRGRGMERQQGGRGSYGGPGWNNRGNWQHRNAAQNPYAVYSDYKQRIQRGEEGNGSDRGRTRGLEEERRRERGRGGEGGNWKDCGLNRGYCHSAGIQQGSICFGDQGQMPRWDSNPGAPNYGVTFVGWDRGGARGGGQRSQRRGDGRRGYNNNSNNNSNNNNNNSPLQFPGCSPTPYPLPTEPGTTTMHLPQQGPEENAPSPGVVHPSTNQPPSVFPNSPEKTFNRSRHLSSTADLAQTLSKLQIEGEADQALASSQGADSGLGTMSSSDPSQLSQLSQPSQGSWGSGVGGNVDDTPRKAYAHKENQTAGFCAGQRRQDCAPGFAERRQVGRQRAWGDGVSPDQEETCVMQYAESGLDPRPRGGRGGERNPALPCHRAERLSTPSKTSDRVPYKKLLKSPKNEIQLSLEDEHVQKAIKHFNLSVEVGETNIRAVYDLGLMYKAAGDYDKAEKYFRKVIDTNMNSHTPMDQANACEQIGLCYLKMSEAEDAPIKRDRLRDKATREFQKAIEVQCKAARNIQGLSVEETWCSFTTLKALLEGEEVSNTPGPKLKALAKLHELIGNYRDAIKFYEELRRLDPSEWDNFDTMKKMVEAYSKRDHHEDAILLLNLMCSFNHGGEPKEVKKLSITTYLSAAHHYHRNGEETECTGCFQALYSSCNPRLSEDNDNDDDVWDIVILHESSEEMDAAGEAVETVLSSQCGIRATRNCNDLMANAYEVEGMVQILERSRAVILLLSSGPLSERMKYLTEIAIDVLQEDANSNQVLNSIIVLLSGEVTQTPRKLKPYARVTCPSAALLSSPTGWLDFATELFETLLTHQKVRNENTAVKVVD